MSAEGAALGETPAVPGNPISYLRIPLNVSDWHTIINTLKLFIYIHIQLYILKYTNFIFGYIALMFL
jgi:hypothetical protein